MIPKLYPEGQRVFDTMGLGPLSDAISCKVTEVRNGEFELVMIYPIDGLHYEDISEKRIIYASHEYGKPNEPFRIYRTFKNSDDLTITVHARHVSYELNFIPVVPFYAATCQEAIQGLKTHAWSQCDYEFHTDKVVEGNFNPLIPKSIRESIGGTEGSLLDVFGTAEVEWRDHDVYYWLHRGSDKGVSVRFGKNLMKASEDLDEYSVITGMYPFYRGVDGTVITLPEGAIENEFAEQYVYKKTIVRDCTENFNEPPTEEQLRAFTLKYMKRHNDEQPAISTRVKFIELANTEDYKDIAALERVNLCDTVHVFYEDLGITTKKEVIEYVWDVLLDRYDSVTIGTAARIGLVQSVTSVEERTDQIVNIVNQRTIDTRKNMMDLINGVSGGYVIMHTDADGHPYELLIMDTDNINTAMNVWRFNQNGWAHSTNGYGGPFNMAATIDGGFVADYITTGSLNANLIRTGRIVSSDGKSFAIDLDSNTINSAVYDSFMQLQNKLFQFDPERGLKISSGINSEFYTILSDTRLGFYQGNKEVAWLSNNILYIQDVRVLGGFEIMSPDETHYTRIYVDQSGTFCIQLMGDEQ